LRILRHPGFLAVMVSVLLAMATWRSLLRAVTSTQRLGIAGGELLPVSTNASGLFHAWLDGWHGAGLGNALEVGPFTPILSAGAWVLEHQPFIHTSSAAVGASIAWLLIAAIPLSAWTAYVGARVLARAAWPRAWAALAWASLGTLTTAQASGRLGALVAHILLPLVAAGFVCATRRSAGTTVTFATALALGVTGAFNPALAALGALAALVLLLVGPGVIRARAAVLLLVPVALMGPWILRLVDNPLLLLAGPGLTVWHGAAGSAPWQLALLHPGGPGSYPALLSGPIVLAGVVAMVRRGTSSRAMTVLAVLAVTGLALGVTAPHVVIGHVPGGAGGGGPITAWAGTGLDIAALALIAAAVLGLDGLPARRPGFGWHILVIPVVAAAVLGVVASMTLTGWFGVGKTLTSKVVGMPAVAADQADGPLRNRLLVMTSEAGTIGYALSGREPGAVVRDLPADAVAPNPPLAAALELAVNREATSVSGVQDALADLGVGFVAFRGAPTEPLVRRLDATAGMARLSDSRRLILWRVLPRENAVSSSRLRLVDTQGALLRSLPVTGEHGRTEVRIGAHTTDGTKVQRELIVAEPAQWADHADVRFAGRKLVAVAGGDQPTYVLPPNAGQLSISLAPSHQWWRWGQLGLLLLVLFMAAPFGPSRSRRTS
jgi:hypothetical protein